MNAETNADTRISTIALRIITWDFFDVLKQNNQFKAPNSTVDNACHTHIDSKSTPKVLQYFGTPKIINFPFVSNGKYMFFMCPNIQAHYNEAVLCLNFGTPENNDFPFGTNGKFIFRCPNT